MTCTFPARLGLLIWISIASLWPSVTWSRWAAPAEADVILEKQDVRVQVLKDGSYHSVVENIFLIQTQKGVERFSSESISYDGTFMKLRVTQAEVTVHQQVTKVAARQIEDRKIPMPGGVGNARRVTISFLNLQVGAHVRYRYEVDAEPELPGLYSQLFLFGLSQPQLSAQISVFSALPLHLKSQDPDQFFDIQESKAGAQFQATIRLKKPASFGVVGEPQATFESTQVPSVQFSTWSDWKGLAQHLAPEWEKYLTRKVEGAFQEILASARTKSTDYEKIVAITEGVQNKLEYLGDWRGQQNQFIPRPWRDLVGSKFGDCKDFSALTALLLRNLGFAADVALVRTIQPPEFSLPRSLPTLRAFNHAVVRVKTGDQVHWVDAVRKPARLGPLVADLDRNEAFILTGPEPGFVSLPNPSFRDSQVDIQKQIEMSPTRTLLGKGSLSLTGLAALKISDKRLKEGSPEIAQQAWSWIGQEIQPEIQELREVHLPASGDALSATWHFKAPATVAATNVAYYYAPLPTLVGRFLFSTKDRLHGAWTGSPITIHQKTELQKIPISETENHGCWVVSPWLDVHRWVSSTTEQSTVHDDVVLKVNSLTPSDIQNREFQTLQSDLAECAEKSWLALTATPKSEPPLEQDDTSNAPKPWSHVALGLWNKARTRIISFWPLAEPYLPEGPLPEKPVAEVPPPKAPETAEEILQAWVGNRTDLFRARDWIYKNKGRHPQDPDSQKQLAEIIRLLGQRNEDEILGEYVKRAYEFVEKSLAQAPKNSDSLALKAQILLDMKQSDLAQALIAELRTQNPALPQVKWLEALQAEKSQNFAEAAKILSEMAQKELLPFRKARWFVELAQIYKKSSQPEFEKTALQSAVQASPRSWPLRYRMATLHIDRGESELAIAELEKILKQENVKPARWTLAREYGKKAARLYQEGRHLHEAGNLFAKATEMDPNWEEGHYNLGLFYSAVARLKDDETYLARADQAFRKCLELNPQHGEAKKMLDTLRARVPATIHSQQSN